MVVRKCYPIINTTIRHLLPSFDFFFYPDLFTIPRVPKEPHPVHIMVSIPVHVAISRLAQHIKGKSAYILLSQFVQLRRQYWGRHIWARGYFCCSSGNVTNEVIKAYIENQKHDADDNFRIGDRVTSLARLRLRPLMHDPALVKHP
uniref:Transposase IS200 like n=1 Tax=Candidatus Kentrum sp. FM TaxID=2126340 RepID=A0A450SNS8_9GAMM|nr:MAG: Transposase IS200 like [Candidatus Kentron sp. FM]